MTSEKTKDTRGTWIKYGHFHYFSLGIGFLAGTAVSFLYVVVKLAPLL
ncbi:hypothetical protein [Marinobacter sp. ELB17]|nr:hypothetical protein [Marinobacter sp. ELB17]EAZ97478.1 hypothetical protein MELB17_10033 [Marinobacter sp. ELB17]